ncbi:MAG: inorganic diphosphatase [Candidatus Dasytiphilus stammeri]
MYLDSIPSGENLPDDIYVIIEIPLNSNSIKYEMDKNSGTLFVDRFLNTSMLYPCNYGYINHTLSNDGDPLDSLVIGPSLQAKSVILCRPIGMLKMIDESGDDFKIIAVPHSKLTTEYDSFQQIKDLPEVLLRKISHFFTHYKDMERNKWTKIMGWADVEESKQEIVISLERNINLKKK